MSESKTTPDSPNLWDEAYETVLRIRGSYDVPAFQLCVEEEYEKLKEKHDAK